MAFNNSPATLTDIFGLSPCGPWTSKEISSSYEFTTVTDYVDNGSEQYFDTVDIDFDILVSINITIVLGGRDLTGELADSEISLPGALRGWRRPTLQMLLKGQKDDDGVIINLTGNACRKKECCRRKCVRTCCRIPKNRFPPGKSGFHAMEEYTESKTQTGKCQHVYGRLVPDGLTPYFRCETAPYNALLRIQGKGLYTNAPGPLSCGENSVEKCKQDN